MPVNTAVLKVVIKKNELSYKGICRTAQRKSSKVVEKQCSEQAVSRRVYPDPSKEEKK